ncbi:hypothetical protein NUW58_g1495 [Xylaria curta]|uniref:Uncharacterized protein n=1 Tax=Xylaria curta TaxID=42375 RepID=A0ACC1PK70_9PEZI|nr:hypothetical protein NUW58_g1495 [Xylaria curta]
MTRSTPKITTRSTAGQVQQAMHYSNIQWRRFLIITTEEAVGLDRKTSWRDVPAQQQQSLMNDVKDRLEQEQMIQSNDNLEKAIQWRMPQVFKAQKAKNMGGPTKFGAVPPGDAGARASVNLGVDGSKQSADVTSAPTVQEMFDPIRNT